MNDVMLSDEDKMKSKLEDIIEKCRHKNFSVRADTFMPYGELDEQISKIKKWAGIADQYLRNK